MPVQSKNKGSGFERTIANYLSARFAECTGKPQSFRRAPDSGSYFGGTNDTRIETHLTEHLQFGDIIAPSNFRWTLEAKAYKTPLSLNCILTQKSKQLDDWISQAETEATNAGKFPLLVIKFNNCAPFVLAKEMHPGSKFNYKKYHCYLLEEFFARPDSNYFTPPSTAISVVA